jgi:hypothetical protein
VVNEAHEWCAHPYRSHLHGTRRDCGKYNH